MTEKKKLILALAVLFALNILVICLAQAAQALTYQKGSTGSAVKQIQTKLKTWGYYSGSVDGVYGSATEKAVRSFQKKNGLTVDGKAGPQTLKAMGISGGDAASVGSGDLALLARLISAEARGEPYNGQVEIQTGEIGDDLAYYFTVSEQTPSAVGLGVMVDTDSSVKHSGGFIIQIMPNASEETISALEEKLNGAPSVTSMMEEGLKPEDILEYYLGGLGLQINETMPVRFHCDCSKEKVGRALATISTKDLEDIINDGEEIEVKCYFCNAAYTFGIDELREIMGSRE
jgi:redox-regulated HSP33 family molecular chaperone